MIKVDRQNKYYKSLIYSITAIYYLAGSIAIYIIPLPSGSDAVFQRFAYMIGIWVAPFLIVGIMCMAVLFIACIMIFVGDIFGIDEKIK